MDELTGSTGLDLSGDGGRESAEFRFEFGVQWVTR